MAVTIYARSGAAHRMNLLRYSFHRFGTPPRPGTIHAMAKKKSEPSSAKKPAAKKSSSKSKSTGGGGPLVDTSLAAQNAARMLAAGLSLKKNSGTAPQRPESSSFKQLRANLNKSTAPGGLDSVLDKTGGPQPKRPNLPNASQERLSHNQTFGTEANRVNVPRRTPG